MRAPQDVPSAAARVRGRRVRVWLLVALGVVVLIAVLKALATVFTDSLWFSSVNLHSVWWTLLEVKAGLFAVFGAVFFVLVWANLTACDRTSSRHPAQSSDDEVVRRYQRSVRPHAGRLHLAVAVVLALIGGAVAVGQWDNWLLFTHSQSFGAKDPQFGLNVGFFVFKLPFLQFLVDWSLGVLVVTLVVSVAFHYLNGGIRTQQSAPRVSPQVKVHLSVLLALVALAKAAGYFLQRYSLDVSTNGYVEGAGYTDVHARLPAIEVLFGISLFSAAILLYNIRRQGWHLPIVAIGLWAFVALVIGVIYPAMLQWLHVGPAQSKLEQPYITRNIKATRAAYGLDTITVTSHYPDNTTVTATDVADDITSLQNIRLWDPTGGVAAATFNKTQDVTNYYSIPSVQPDRYTVGGTMRPVDVGVRQIDTTALQSPGWVNTHLQYTHGNGVVMAQANKADVATGNPEYAVYTIPPKSSKGYPKITQPAVYFGETLPGYVVADTQQAEVDRQSASGTVESHYKGSGGVSVGSFLNRAAFALRLGDFNLLISGLITTDSKIMFVRNIRTMAEKAAPFLSFDSQPYAVVVKGQIYWILPGYTTTSEYPYSENADNVDVPAGSGLPDSYNYVRNSVEVVVNAYTGSMTFYAIDHDPILKAYQAAFPTMFKTFTRMPPGIRQHLRYAQDMFAVQAAMYGRYHLTKPSQFYSEGYAWLVSPTYGVSRPNQTLQLKYQVNSQGRVVGATYEPMTPLYQVLQEPGEDVQSFTVTDAYVPAGTGSKQTPALRAFLMGSSDGVTFGKLRVYETPPDKGKVAPIEADLLMSATPAVSTTLTYLDQHGSTVRLGTTLLIPVGNSVIYVRPLYVQAKAAVQPQPELKRVIGSLGHRVVIRPTLDAMLDTLLGTALAVTKTTSSSSSTTTVTTPTTTKTSTPPSSVSQDVAKAKTDLATAAKEFTDADAALKAGNLGTYQADVKKAQTLTAQAEALLTAASHGGGSGTSAPPSTTTTTTPTTTVPSSTTTTAPPASTTSTTSATTPASVAGSTSSGET